MGSSLKKVFTRKPKIVPATICGITIKKLKTLPKSYYAVYLRYSTFLIRWGFKFYQEWVIPFMIRTLVYFKLVYPKIKDFVIQMLKFIHQLDLQYRPILMPIVLQVMEYIETTWSLVYSIVSSPVRLGLFVTRIIKEFVDPLLTLISGLVFDWYIRTSDFCTKCFTAGYEKVMVFVRIGKSWLVYGLVCGKEYSEYLNKIVVGYIVEYQILEKLGHLQHIVYQSLIAATIYIKVQAEIVMMAARKFVNRTKTEIEIISDAFNRVFRKPAK